jgi:hypothetical protein
MNTSRSPARRSAEVLKLVGEGQSYRELGIRQRGPYHARHSSVTWRLMLGKNLLWVAKQHGDSVFGAALRALSPLRGSHT